MTAPWPSVCPSALVRRGMAAGVEAVRLDEAVDGENAREDVIALIVEAEALTAGKGADE